MLRYRIFFILFLISDSLFFSTSSAEVVYSDAVHINEFLPDPDGDDARFEFIELYNSSATDVDISGWKLENASGKVFQIPSSISILGGGYVVFYSSETGSMLANTGDRLLRLTDPIGVVHEEANYSGSTQGYSYNRTPTGVYEKNKTPTPNAANIIAPTPTPVPTPTATPIPIMYSSEIHISEFLPNPEGDDSELEFIELHNASSSVVDVSGWIIDTGPTSRFTISLGTSMGAGEFLAFFSAANDISLSNSSDHIQFIRPDLVIQDDIAYTATKEGYSYNRSDAGTYDQSFTPTPNATNTITASPTPSPKPSPSSTHEAEIQSVKYDLSSLLVINELLPNPKGSDEEYEFIEIKNMDKKTVRLAGWMLDDVAKGSGFHFTDESIGAGKLLVLERKKTKIALNNDTDTVKLIDPDGKIVAMLTYAKTVPEGQSWSRDEDGTYAWAEAPTPGKENTIVVLEKVFPTPASKNLEQARPKKTKNIVRASAFKAPVVLAARDQKLPWTEMVSRTVVLPAEFPAPHTGRQKIFILLGTIAACTQLASSIFHKERIWRM